MDGLGFLVLVATFIIAVVALNKSSKLDARLAQLKVEFGKLKDELTALRCGPLPTAEAPPIETLAEEAAAAPAASEEAPAEAAAAAEAMAEPVLTEAPVAAPPRDVEGTLASRWYVWLAFALALFIAGIRLAKQYVRYAGLGVMVIVVLKVFLWDMASLEGLYRIASFVGLGLCLVGIGWLYQRFVDKPRGGAGIQTAATQGGEHG